MKKATLILSLVFVVFTSIGMAQDIGDPAPDFTFQDLDGSSFTLSEQEGKLVVIYVFGYNCSHCYSSGPIVQQKLVEPYEGNEKYVIVGIDIWDGSVGALENFQSRTGVEMPLMLNGSSFATNYNSVQDRLFVIGEEGTLIHRAESSVVGDVNRVVPIIEDKLDIVSSVENTQTSELAMEVYPNPVVGGELNLSFNMQKRGYADAKIISSDGRTVLQPASGSFNQGTNNIRVDLGGLSSGVYFVVLTVDGIPSFRKILVD